MFEPNGSRGPATSRQLWGQTCVAGDCYTAYLEDREVACGAMLLDNGIAVLGLGATSAEARHRGCQTVGAESCDVPADRAGAGRNFQRAAFVEAGRSIGWRRPLISTESLRGSASLR